MHFYFLWWANYISCNEHVTSIWYMLDAVILTVSLEWANLFSLLFHAHLDYVLNWNMHFITHSMFSFFSYVSITHLNAHNFIPVLSPLSNCFHDQLTNHVNTNQAEVKELASYQVCYSSKMFIQVINYTTRHVRITSQRYPHSWYMLLCGNTKVTPNTQVMRLIKVFN